MANLSNARADATTAGTGWPQTFGVLVAALGFVAASLIPMASLASDSGDWLDRVFSSRNSSTVVNSDRSREERLAVAAKQEAELRNEEAFFRASASADMMQGIRRYREIVSNGGWPEIPRQSGAWLRLGSRDQRVPYLEQRLRLSGDISGPHSRSNYFDERIEAGLKAFQVRHGLRPNGVVDLRTLATLNIPAEERLRTLEVNIHRVRGHRDQVAESPRYVVVNSASYDLQAVRGETVELYSRTIVGRDATQTPTIEAEIRGMNFLPFWRVPNSIAGRDIIPRLRKDPGYLEREKIRVLTNWGGTEIDPSTIDWNTITPDDIKFRQDPGEHNALGTVRIDMPNDDIVYLHDTPMKPLFGRNARAFSAGCVRVENVLDLTAWLASGEEGWNRNRMEAVIGMGVAEDLKLTEPVQVLFVYLTAWVGQDGRAHFRPDIYGRDGRRMMMAAYEGEEAVPVTLSP